ncbi:hypothetical protein QUT75_22665, partial [Xanthomonas citri pv. citri]
CMTFLRLSAFDNENRLDSVCVPLRPQVNRRKLTAVCEFCNTQLKNIAPVLLGGLEGFATA